MVKDVLGLFTSMGKLYRDQNKDTSIVKLITTVNNSVSAVVGAMETFLKRNGIDVRTAAGQAKAKSSSAWGSMKKLADPLVNRAKAKFKNISDRSKGVAADLHTKYQSTLDGSIAPPSDDFVGPMPQASLADKGSAVLGVAGDAASGMVDRANQYVNEKKAAVESGEGFFKALFGNVGSDGKPKDKSTLSMWSGLRNFLGLTKGVTEATTGATKAGLKTSGKAAASAAFTLIPELGTVWTGIKSMYAITKFMNDAAKFAIVGSAKILHRTAKAIIPGYSLLSKGLGAIFRLPGLIARGVGNAITGTAGFLWEGVTGLAGKAKRGVGSFLKGVDNKLFSKDMGKSNLTGFALHAHREKELAKKRKNPIMHRLRNLGGNIKNFFSGNEEDLDPSTTLLLEQNELIKEGNKINKEGLETVAEATVVGEDGLAVDSTGRQKRGWWTKLKDRMSGRKEEIEEEKRKVQEGKEKKEPGWLSKILKKVGLISAGLAVGWGLLKKYGWEGVSWLGGKIWDGLVWTGKQIWEGTKWVAKRLPGWIWEGTKWIGKKLWEGTKWLGEKLWEGTKWVATRLGGFMMMAPKATMSILRGGFRGLSRVLGGVGKLLGWTVKGVGKLGVGLFKLPLKIAGGVAKALIPGFGMVTKVIGSLGRGLGRVIGGLGKGLIKGLGGTIGKVIGGLGKGLGGVLGKVVGKLPGGAKKGLLSKGFGLAKSLGGKVFNKVGGGALVKGAGWLAKKVGVKALARTGLALLGPIGVAINVGMLLWDAYSLYKWIKEGGEPKDIPGKLTELRLLAYGFGKDNRDDAPKVLQLEELLHDKVDKDMTGRVIQVKELDDETNEAVFGIFDIDTTDTNSEEYMNFVNWYSHRFIPVYEAFRSSMFMVTHTLGDLKLGELEKMTPQQSLDFTAYFTLPSRIFDLIEIPSNDGKPTIVTRDDFQTKLKELASFIKDKFKDTKDEDGVILATKKQARREAAAMKKRYQEKKQQQAQDNQANVPPPTNNNLPSDDYEDPKLHAPKNTSNSSSNSGLLPGREVMAGGELFQGDASLVGIRLQGGVSKDTIMNLDPNVFQLFTGMAKEYHALTGNDIGTSFGWRDTAEQARLHKANPAKAAAPGNSLHEFGLAIDINSVDVKKLNELGLLKKYGFATAIGKETWHIEPIGVSLDPQRAKTDLEWRRNIITASPGRGGSGFALHYKGDRYTRNYAFQQKLFEEGESNTTLLPPGGYDSSSIPGPWNGVSAGLSPDKDGTANSTGSVDISGLFKSLSKGANKSGRIATTGLTPSSFSHIPGQGGQHSRLNITGFGDYEDPSQYKAGPISGTKPSAEFMMKAGSNMDPIAAIKQAADMTGVDYDLMLTMAKLESGLKVGAKAGTSSATGLFQFTSGTWNDMMKRVGSKYGIPSGADRTNPLYNSIMGAEYIKFNSNYIKGHQEAGIPTPIALYLAHFLGSGGVGKFIRAYTANPGTPMSQIVSSEQYNANLASMGGKTAAQFLQGIVSRFQTAQGTSNSAYGSGLTNTPTSTPMSTPMPSGYSNVPVSLPQPTTVGNSGFDSTGTPNYSGTSSKPVDSSSSNNIPTIDTSVQETLMKSQLHLTGEILKVLTGISDKIDPEAFGELLASNTNVVGSDVLDRKKTIPKSSVDLSRRKVT